MGIAAKIRWAPVLQSAYEHLAKGSADSVLPPHYALDNKPRTSFSSQISGASQGRVTSGNFVADLIKTKILSFSFQCVPIYLKLTPIPTYFLWIFYFFFPAFLMSLRMPHLGGAESHGMRTITFVKETLSFFHTDQSFTLVTLITASYWAKNQNPVSPHCCCVVTSLGKTRNNGLQKQMQKTLYHEPNLRVLHLWRALPLDPLFVTGCAGLVGNDPFLSHLTLSWHCNATATLHTEFPGSTRADSPSISLKWKITDPQWCLQGTFSWKSQHTVLLEERKGYTGRMNEQWRQKLHSHLVLPIWWGFLTITS